MGSSELITFALISFAFIIVPGPNVLVIISTSMTAGQARGLQTVAGTSLAMSVQLLIAAIATSWLLSLLARGLFWLKWCGVAYLLWMGVTSFYKFYHRTPGPGHTALGSFQRGFWVSLTNPKTILFFSAFLPQFANESAPYLEQIAVLSLIFWLLAIVADSFYALAAAKLRTV
ncbi:MAG: LysE family translocator, partial [Gammaproteobacteria bacterium]|nr:LysE family translocator [Gammaproteobacteria bacterium]